MSTKSNTNQVILDIIQEGVQKKILHLNTDEESISGTRIHIQGKKVVNFSSCSYLGLEQHEALKRGAKAAIDAYGTQFSSSRAYISLGLYEKLESQLSSIFQNNSVVVTATTTLGHIAAIPVLIEDGDAVLIDHQVHHSVQTAAGLLRSKNVYIEMIRHNNLNILEEKIVKLKSRHSKIWYLADGVYSMFGDVCPVADILSLLAKHEQFHLYIDDAHGMSYFGKHGSGYVCSQVVLHPRMVLGTSLNKAFASGGGVLVFPDRELHKKVRTCGSTLITSGPLQPPNLGAAIAAAEIHLSNEIYDLQDNLADKIKFTQLLLTNAGLPLISESGAAIFFIGVALPKIGYEVVAQMLRRGYYLNLGIFPAVPIKNTGIRFTITALHTYKEISDMVNALKEEFDKALNAASYTLEQVWKSFRKDIPATKKTETVITSLVNQALHYSAAVYNSIKDIDRAEWNRMFSGRGAFDWEALCILEEAFSGNSLPEDNWSFDYIIIRNKAGEALAATFTTTALWKDDMLSPAEISVQIEELRKKDPYYLVSRITSSGSLITEGEHIFINKLQQGWEDALRLMLDNINDIHQVNKSAGVVLRDFCANEDAAFPVIAGNGYFKVPMPDTHIAELAGWHTPAEFFESLSRKGKMHFRTDVKRFYGQFQFVIRKTASKEEINRWYEMYMAVRKNNLALNTFPLPLKFFYMILNNSAWEANVLIHTETGKEMAVVFSYRSESTFVPTIIGMDYKYLHTHKIYKQTLFRLLERAVAAGCSKVQMGFGAATEKRKLNCKPVSVNSFVQLQDNFNAEYIRNYKAVSS